MRKKKKERRISPEFACWKARDKVWVEENLRICFNDETILRRRGNAYFFDCTFHSINAERGDSVYRVYRKWLKLRDVRFFMECD